MTETTEYNYEKVMREEKLTLDELPEDAKVGIASLKSMQNGINVLGKKGKKPRVDTVSKIKAMDKWIVREILDYVEGKETNTEAPVTKEEVKEVVAEMKEQATEAPVVEVKAETTTVEEVKPAPAVADPKGLAIEEELKKLIQSGKLMYSIEELKSVAPKSYAVIFDNYDASGDNGIECSNCRIIETDEKLFTVSYN